MKGPMPYMTHGGDFCDLVEGFEKTEIPLCLAWPML